MKLALILLARCNASCAHCSKSYGPHRSGALSKDDILRLMEEAAAIDDGEPLEFALTGGEPFLNFELLSQVIAHGARLGARVSCVTNAYWARTVEYATDRLTILRDAGLTSLAVSVSRFHQEFIPIKRVQRVLEAAALLGITTELKGAVTNSDAAPGGVLAKWKDMLDADRINIFPVLPQLRNGATLPDLEYYRESGLPTHKCPGEILCIDFEGVARSCGAPASNDSFLSVGNVHDSPLKEIHQNLAKGAVQKILRESGPIAFARAAISAGLGDRLRNAYAGPCDLCLHVRSDAELRRVAKEMVSLYIDTVRPNPTEPHVNHQETSRADS